MRISKSVCACLVLAGNAAHADQHCGGALPMSMLNGSYTVSIGNALLFADNTVVPLKSLHSFVADMDAQDDLLMMAADGIVVVLEWAGPDDGALNYKELQQILDVDPNDLNAWTGCPVDALPILVGGGLAQSSDGKPIEFRYELAVTDAGGAFMMGTVHWSGGSIQSMRAVTVTRN